MDSFEANKIFGAVLGTVFVLFGGSLLAESIFHSEVPEQAGYAIEVPEDTGAGPAEEVAAVPIAVLLQDADAEAGSTIFRRCQSCHSNEDGAPAGVGPHLWDVVNREVAHDPGFSYSTAMQEFAAGGTVWDFEHLNEFLLNPRQDIPGTAMGFAGIANDGDRADLIAYLRTLSNDPAPLPEPPAAEPEPEASAEGVAPEGIVEGEDAPVADDTAPVTSPQTDTDHQQSVTGQPQMEGVTDPDMGQAPISNVAPTGQATDPEAAEPNLPGPEIGETPALDGETPAVPPTIAPATQAPAQAPAPAPAIMPEADDGTTVIVPAQ